jgi:hypothetical protein
VILKYDGDYERMVERIRRAINEAGGPLSVAFCSRTDAIPYGPREGNA